jgi:hypothetical protein
MHAAGHHTLDTACAAVRPAPGGAAHMHSVQDNELVTTVFYQAYESSCGTTHETADSSR